MEELLQMIQQDPELWELVEQLKHQDEDPSDFILSVAQMLAIERTVPCPACEGF